MELTKCSDVIKLLKKSNSYLYQQEKLYIFVNDKTYIIHDVNQKSHDYIINKINSKVSNLVEIKIPRTLKSSGCNWTPEEDQIILKDFNSIEILCSVLTERSKKAIMERRKKLKE